MHFEQRVYVDTVRREFPEFFHRTRVLEVGSYDVNGSIRSLFDATEYVGLDLAPGPGVDVVAFGHEFTSDQLFDITISCECFEHDPHFRETFSNMVKLTRPGGLVVFTCATSGRVEHGTMRANPESSPGTVLTGIDYYRNVTEEDFSWFDFRGVFSGFRFFVSPGSQDLYFVGSKHPGAEQLDDRLARIAVAVGELTRVSMCLAEAGKVNSSGEPGKAAEMLGGLEVSGHPSLSAHTLHMQIWYFLSAKRLAEAERASDLLLSTNDRAEYFWQRSVLMHLLERNEAAIDAARAAITRAPTNGQFQQHLGTLLIGAGRLDEAEQPIVLACTLSPLNAVAQHRLSMLRFRQKRLEEAVVAAERAVTLAPGEPLFATHLETLRILGNNSHGGSARGPHDNLPADRSLD